MPPLEKGRKSRGYVPDDVVVDAGENADNSLPGGNWVGLRESYLQGNDDLHVHFLIRVDREGLETCYLCAIFDDASVGKDVTRGNPSDVSASGGIKSESLETPSNDVEKPVLVDAGQFVQLPERMAAESLAPPVRLQGLDVCLRLWVNSAKFVQTTRQCRDTLLRGRVEQAPSDPAVAPPIFIPEDRELRTLCEVVGQRLGMSACEIKGDMVEAATKVLKAIPQKQLDTFVGLIGLDNESCVTRVIRIGFSHDGVVLSLSELGIFAFDLVQMVKRPSELRPLPRREDAE